MFGFELETHSHCSHATLRKWID